MLEAVLARTDDGQAELDHGRLVAVRRFLLLHAAARSWMWFLFQHAGFPLTMGVFAAALSVLAALALAGAWHLAAVRAALAIVAVQTVWSFPLGDDAFYIELFALVLVSLPALGSAVEETRAIRALRWLTLLVLFHTGLQKVLYGYYFRGDFLAYMMAKGESFAAAFRALVPAEELARLRTYPPYRTGSGPFRVAAPGLVIAANAVWLLEMLLPPLLVVRATRTVAALAAIVFVFALEPAAREYGFALLFSNLLLLFLPGNWNARLLPLFYLAYAGILVIALGQLPGASLFRAGLP